MAKHPHFNDQGAIDWFTDFKTALQEARRSNKKLFIESGRRA